MSILGDVITFDEDKTIDIYATISVTYPEGSTCQVTKNTTVISAPDTTGQTLFCVPSKGTWTVSATNGTESAQEEIVINEYGQAEEITLSYSKPLNECTPAEIQQVAQAGLGDIWWDIGDQTAPITLSSYGNFTGVSTVCAFIIGFDHNSELEGTGIHFQLGKLVDGKNVALVDSGYGVTHSSGTWFGMKNADNNSGGWDDTLMYSTICPGFYNTALPAEWRNIIVDTDKYTDNTKGTSSSYVTKTTGKLWLLAEYEVFGTITQGNTYESSKQQQYEFYKNGNSKIKYKHNATSTTCEWKLRSVIPNNNYAFSSVGTAGTIYNDNYGHYSKGFAPGFKVG